MFVISGISKQRRVWKYQRDNQNLYIEEEQTTQLPKETMQKDKQRSTKHTYKTKAIYMLSTKCLICVISVCLCRVHVVPNTYCVLFLFCLSSSCVPYVADNKEATDPRVPLC